MSDMNIKVNDKRVIGTMGADRKINYGDGAVKSEIKEMIAGQSSKTTGYFNTTGIVSYRYDKSRKTGHDKMWALWKVNPLLDNRVKQLNALIFGRGLKWTYDTATQGIVDRFWRVNRLRDKLNAMGTDGQIYGEVFVGLFPQKSGDVLVSFYESRQIDIDFEPSDIYNVRRYIVTYKDEESGKDEQFDMMPIESYLNEIEFAQGINANVIGKVRRALGLHGSAKVKGKGVMCHIKFNNSTSEVYGTSDFYQSSDFAQDYIDFIGDRLSIHQMYGSPAYDITIDTDDPQVINDRIDELSGFAIGSNPVHNKQEEWKPLGAKDMSMSPTADDKLLRGILSAGLSFPEYMLFNQSEGGNENTFSVTTLAQDRQDTYKSAFTDIHKFVVAIAGGDISLVDNGEIIFPEIDTTSEKTKAETYVLKVGANIVSRRTAATNMGHNFDIELERIKEERTMFGDLSDSSDFAGALGGRFTNKQNSTDDTADDGSKDRKNRNDATRVNTTQVMRSEKQRD